MYCKYKNFVKCFIDTHCRRLYKTTEIFVTIENVFFYLIYIYIYIYIDICIANISLLQVLAFCCISRESFGKEITHRDLLREHFFDTSLMTSFRTRLTLHYSFH